LKKIFDRDVPKYTQIGNAVPVRLAFEHGKRVARLLRDYSGRK
jgi:site-specific DNA-cytosine methylase